ncbi:putative peptidoglycan lipid II flippase [Novimethylophilus kurashikiensis]|uniref:Probable lipid II flippase MurJ n=1 Tax=Novimethylophilus kurashikiensis TaxID=1825523 RepID=A0A2R5F9E0_9PROT|nr:murein biosynthesis integral membrane protein MurJ [Novimethylophilus kurashikiensis]GBG14158.1 putative peptidoglycan lipid II flippase [Novimethylophilus kurashikiensis]
MNLLRALAAVGSMTFLSRILGFVRDTLVARVFGAGAATDAFFIAFKIPNLLRRMFAEGAFSQAFVPVLAEYKERRGQEATQHLVNHVASLLSLVLFGVTVLGILAAPWVVYLSAPGFKASPDTFQLTIQLLRVTFPYILFISLASLAGAVLNTYGRFSIPAFTPTLLNITFILFSLFLVPYFNPPIMALAWAVFIGGILQLFFQVPYLIKLGFRPRFSLDWGDEGVWRIVKLMGPAMFGVSIAQISLLINTIFASFLQTGSVSWLYYADRLMEFPTGVLGVALGTILLPSLSKTYADASHQEYSKLLDWGLRLTFMLAAPAAVAFAVLAVPLVTSLFKYGQFNEQDVWMTCQALVAYSAGLLGLIVVKVLAPGFYARQNIKTPVKIAVFTLGATQLMNLAFIWQLKHAGLALAIGLGACLNAGLLYYNLRRHNIYHPQPGWLPFVLKLATALAVMAATLAYLSGPSEAWLHYAVHEKLVRLSILVLAGAGSYFAALGLLGFRPRDFTKRVSA